MKKVRQSNNYFFVILLLQLFLPVHLIFSWLKITDIKIILLVNHIIIFIIPAIIYLALTKQSPKKVLRLNKIYFKDAILIVTLAFVCQPIMSFFSLISQFFFENEIANFIGQIVETPYWVLVLLVAVLPSITEEITIRGVILSGYDNTNTYVACIVSGLLFGIMHLDPQQFLYATVLGVILALVVRITNSIFAASIMHFIINGTSITLQKVLSFGENNIGDISFNAMAISEKIVLIVQYLILAIIFSWLAYIIIKKLKKNNIKRGVYIESSYKRSYNEEKAFDLPLILIIFIYLIVMIKQII